MDFCRCSGGAAIDANDEPFRLSDCSSYGCCFTDRFGQTHRRCYEAAVNMQGSNLVTGCERPHPEEEEEVADDKVFSCASFWHDGPHGKTCFSEKEAGKSDWHDSLRWETCHSDHKHDGLNERRGRLLFTQLHDEACLAASWRGVWESLSNVVQSKTPRAVNRNRVTQCLWMVAEIAKCNDDCSWFCEQFEVCPSLDAQVDSRTKVAQPSSYTLSRALSAGRCKQHCRAWAGVYIFDPGGASDALRSHPTLNYADKQIGTRLDRYHMFRIIGGSVTAVSALLKKVHRKGLEVLYRPIPATSSPRNS